MSILDDLANLLFPKTCHICGALLAPHEQFICLACKETLPRTGYHRQEMNPMEQRFAGIFPFERATGHFFYSRGSSLSVLVQDMKYRSFPGIGRMLGKIAGEELYPSGFFAGVELAVPVPMHSFKRWGRGYNQAEVITRGLGDAINVPVGNVLKAVKPHMTQTALSHEERRENVKGLFRLVRPEDVAGRHVLLVDDICTTGATLTAAAEALREGKPSALTLLSVGVTF